MFHGDSRRIASFSKFHACDTSNFWCTCMAHAWHMHRANFLPCASSSAPLVTPFQPLSARSAHFRFFRMFMHVYFMTSSWRIMKRSWTRIFFGNSVTLGLSTHVPIRPRAASLRSSQSLQTDSLTHSHTTLTYI
jgi:hypothetical protein